MSGGGSTANVALASWEAVLDDYERALTEHERTVIDGSASDGPLPSGFVVPVVDTPIPSVLRRRAQLLLERTEALERTTAERVRSLEQTLGHHRPSPAAARRAAFDRRA